MSITFNNIGRDVISSRTNPLVVAVAKLEDKKYREREGLFRFDGLKLFREAVLCKLPIEYLLLRQSTSERILSDIERAFEDCDAVCESKVILLGDSAFEKISSEKAPEGIICVSKHIDNFHKIGKIDTETASSEQKILLLESIRDPGNLGTIMRTASAFGYQMLVISQDCADLYNSKTLRAAMGAAFRTKTLRVPQIKEAIDMLSLYKRRVFAAALDEKAAKLGSFSIKSTDCFLIGNEGHGLSDESVGACEHSVFIPMGTDTESLNASVAAAVCMWEQSRGDIF